MGRKAKVTVKKPEYWASSDTRTCADEILKRVNDYYTFCMAKGYFSLWRNSYYSYNPNRYTSGNTMLAGESNEYRVMRVNHYKNLVDHIQNLTITDRPVWQTTATNSDAKSQKQCIIAEGLLDYTMREKRVERHLKDACKFSLLFGDGFIFQKWDPTSGEAVASADGQTKHEGDIKYTSLESVDLIRDPNLSSYAKRSWVVARTYENKYDIAAKYPEYADEIVATQTSATSEDDHYLGNNFLDSSFETDQIQILNFFHEKSPACPNGRQIVMLRDGTVLSDSPLLYKHIPIHRIAPGDQTGTPMGQTVAFDLLPIMQMIDGTWTQILSINETYSIPKLVLRHGSDIAPETLASGIQVIKCAAGEEPKIMEMPTADQGLYAALNSLDQLAETISGVNSVSRGNPEASLKSGSALALVESMAIQFNGPLQASYVQLLEDTGMGTIQMYQDFGDEPRIIQIAGQRQRSIVQQSFTGADIDKIDRVQVQAGNALSKTVSGKLQIAQELLQAGVIKTGQEYLQVLQTGNLDPLIQGETAVLLNIATENEMLMDGQDVPTFFTDDHTLHISEHNSIASDPAVRMNPELFEIVAKHINSHITQLMDPAYQNYRLVTNQPNLPPPGMPGAAPGSGPTAPAAGTTSAGPMGAADVQAKAASVNMPNMPKNPLTGERSQPQGAQ